MPINLCQISPPSPLHSPSNFPSRRGEGTYLRLDQHQIDEQDDEIMLDIFVAETSAVLTHGEPHTMAGRSARIFRVQLAGGKPAFYTYGHFVASGSRDEMACYYCWRFQHVMTRDGLCAKVLTSCLGSISQHRNAVMLSW